jgi:hypothetical protein
MMFLNFLSQVLAFSPPLQHPMLFAPQPSYPPDYLDHCTIAEHQTSLLSYPSVALPHKNPTKSFWTHGSDDANPLAKEGSDGPFTTDADIVIIGSGITGVGAAYHLSEAIATTDLSLNIVMFEARDFCENHPCILSRLDDTRLSYFRFWSNWYAYPNSFTACIEIA